MQMPDDLQLINTVLAGLSIPEDIQHLVRDLLMIGKRGLLPWSTIGDVLQNAVSFAFGPDITCKQSACNRFKETVSVRTYLFVAGYRITSKAT